MKRKKSGRKAREKCCRALRRRLEETERRLRQTQEIARVGSFERNLETGEGYWSDEHYRLLGYEPGQIEHSFDFFLAHIHPEDRKRTRDILTGAYERMESFRYDGRFIRRDGEVRWFHHSGRGTVDENGGRWIRGIFQDVTERKRAEEKARESAGRYRVIFEKSPLGIVHFDETGRVLDCNAAFVRLVGSSREKLVGFPALEKLAPAARRVLEKALAGETAVFEDAYTSVTGNRTAELRAVLNPVHPGRRPTEVIATYEDVSERRAAERERRKSEEKFRLLAQAAPIGIWISRGERIVYANPAFLEMTGYAAEEIVGVSLMELIHPDSREYVREKVAARRKGAEGLFRYELKGLHRDGRAFWLDHSSVLIELDGAPSVLGISIDVTDRERAARKLREAREAAEAASHAKTEFIANMSHELRTPLNAILGHCQILVRDESISKTQRNGLAVIEKSGHHLLTLINDILDMSRVEVGKVRLESRPLDLRNLVDGVVDMLRFRAIEKGISLSAEMDPAVPRWVRSDPKRLRQILLNLLSNAVKFTGRGGARVRVFPDGGFVGFSVADTGPGIPEDRREAVFDAFRQLGPPERRSDGTGLGLTISRTLVMLMGGKLTLESRVGEGSTFQFSVPLPPAEAWGNEGLETSSEAEAPIAGAPASSPSSSGRTVSPNPESLVPPGPEDLAALTELARIGNITRITDHARNLARSDPSTAAFCLRLLELADEYDFEKILALLESAGEKTARAPDGGNPP
ncbi:MAG: PAS domain S-box protein [Desulfococcaceae bacterium]